MVPKWYNYAKNTIMFSGASLLALALAAALIWLLARLFPALLPFVFALFLSFIMEPMICLLQSRLKMPRGLAVALSMLVILGSLGTLLVLVSFELISELISISAALPAVSREIWLSIEKLIPTAIRFYGELPPEIITYMQNAIGNFSSALQRVVEFAAASMVSFFSLVPGTVLGIIVTLLATYFISKDRRKITLFWRRVIPAPYGDRSISVVNEVLSAFLAYLKAQSILVTITMLTSIIGLHIIGAKYALTIGLIVGLLDILPVLGPAGIYIPWVVWSFISGEISFGIKLSILYLIILVTRQLLEARVVAANLGLNPLATLMAMYIGFKLIGFFGLVLGPILLIAIQAAFKGRKGFPG